MTDRICAACSKPLVRKANEGSHDFRQRKSCGPSCGSALPRSRAGRYEGLAGICRFCGGATRVKTNGKPKVSCANPACRKKAYQAAHLMDNVPWPKPSGEIVADFRGHNIVSRAAYGTLPLRPATVVLK